MSSSFFFLMSESRALKQRRTFPSKAMLKFSIAAHEPFFKYLQMFVEKAEYLHGLLQNPTRKNLMVSNQGI